MVPMRAKKEETMKQGRFPHFLEHADTIGPDAPATSNWYPEMIVMLLMGTWNSSEMTYRPAFSNGPRVAALRMVPRLIMKMIVSFFVDDH